MKDRTVQRLQKSANDLMLMLGLNDVGCGKQCAWCGDVLRREDGHVLRRALES